MVTFVVGAVAFGALGLAIAAFAPNGDAAVAIANATLLPAAFVSSVFIPLEDPSTLVRVVGSLLPLKPFSLAFQQAVHADSLAAGFAWPVVRRRAVGLGGMVLARYFTWVPKERALSAGRAALGPGTGHHPSVRTSR